MITPYTEKNHASVKSSFHQAPGIAREAEGLKYEENLSRHSPNPAHGKHKKEWYHSWIEISKSSSMHTDPNFQFITEKISLLRTAVMYSMSNSLVRLPNDIVSFVKIDAEGRLWFLAHFPSQSLNECEREFPVRLHFFRKGYDFFVEVSGKATIEDIIVEESCKQVGNINTKRTVLVSMTMPDVEYREPHARKEKSKLQLLVENSYKWMLRHVGVPHTEGSVFDKIHQPH